MAGFGTVSRTLRMPLVGRRQELELAVSRHGDDPSGELCGIAAVLPASGDEARTVLAMADDLSASGPDGMADAVMGFLSGHSWRVRNVTRFRYDLETEVNGLDAEIAAAVPVPADPRADLLAVSMEQVGQMMDELPLSTGTAADRAVAAMFRVAMGNVIRAAYDAGYRDGSHGGGKPPMAGDSLRIPGDTW